MKNAIKYYYNLDVNSIRQKSKTFFFSIADEEYVLVNYDHDEIEAINEASLYLSNYIPCHQIISNINNGLRTNINNDIYILLKIKSDYDKIIVEDIIKMNNMFIQNKILDKSNWFDLWVKKIDYFEYQISQMGRKYSLIANSFSYYVGLAESAINIFKAIPKSNLYLSLNHHRIKYDDTNFDLYNPLNFVVDYRFRDICEYYKDGFFNDVEVSGLIKIYLFNLNDNEKQMFFVRMLFPTYYFDCYEKIINNEIDEICLNKIISKVNDYERLLKEIYLSIPNLPKIEWLI